MGKSHDVKFSSFSFSIPLLYEMSLDIICFKGAFNAMSMKYNYLHSAGQGEQERYSVCEKRLIEAWHMYTLIEQMQRYMISGPVSRGDTIELSLKHYLPLLNLEFLKNGQDISVPNLDVVHVLSSTVA